MSITVNFEHWSLFSHHFPKCCTCNKIQCEFRQRKLVNPTNYLILSILSLNNPLSVNTLPYFDLNARPDIWILNRLYSPSSLSSYTLLFLECVILWQFSWQCCAIEKTRPINYLVDRTTLVHWNLVFLTTATASFYTSFHLILFLFHNGLD